MIRRLLLCALLMLAAPVWAQGITGTNKPTDVKHFVQYVTISLSSAQLQTISSVPVLVLKAPGAGKAIYVLQAWMEYVFNTVGFGANGRATLIYGPTYATTSDLFFPAPAGAAQTPLSFASGFSTVSLSSSALYQTFANSAVLNQPLYVTNNLGNPAAGNGTATLTVAYVVECTAPVAPGTFTTPAACIPVGAFH